MKLVVKIELNEDYVNEMRRLRFYQQLQNVIRLAIDVALIGRGKVYSIKEEVKKSTAKANLKNPTN